MQPAANLEPVPRDPRKLRNTALILVAIMVIGGFFIMRAYNRWAEGQSSNERPAYAGGRLTAEKDLPLLVQDGNRAALFDLAGKVSVIHAISASQPETAALSKAVAARLAAHYAGNKDLVLVSLVLDPGPSKTAKSTIAAAAEAMHASLPGWWVGSTEPQLIHKYIKKELKSEIFPQEVDGKWKYDTSLVLVDRNRHLRKAVVPQKRGGPPFVANFDFDEAAGWDAKGVKTGTGRTNVEELEALLVKTIDELLAETAGTP